MQNSFMNDQEIKDMPPEQRAYWESKKIEIEGERAEFLEDAEAKAQAEREYEAIQAVHLQEQENAEKAERKKDNQEVGDFEYFEQRLAKMFKPMAANAFRIDDGELIFSDEEMKTQIEMAAEEVRIEKYGTKEEKAAFRKIRKEHNKAIYEEHNKREAGELQSIRENLPYMQIDFHALATNLKPIDRDAVEVNGTIFELSDSARMNNNYIKIGIEQAEKRGDVAEQKYLQDILDKRNAETERIGKEKLEEKVHEYHIKKNGGRTPAVITREKSKTRWAQDKKSGTGKYAIAGVRYTGPSAENAAKTPFQKSVESNAAFKGKTKSMVSSMHQQTDRRVQPAPKFGPRLGGALT